MKHFKSTYNLSDVTMLVLDLNSELHLFIYGCSKSKVKTSFNVIKPVKSKQTKIHEKSLHLTISNFIFNFTNH